jgi:hypothetical protein
VPVLAWTALRRGGDTAISGTEEDDRSVSTGYQVAAVQRPRITQMAQMRVSTAKSMRKLADDLQDRHPDMGTHAHVRDAARALDKGLATAAGRHLDAAMHTLAPQSLLRHGIHDDAGHMAAKRDMTEVWRHSLLVKDLNDVHEETQSRLAEIRARKAEPHTVPPLQPSSAMHEKVLPARSLADAEKQSVGGSLIGMSSEVELAFNPHQPRDLHGRWSSTATGKVRKLSYPGGPGGNGHAYAIAHLSDKYYQRGDLALKNEANPAHQMLRDSLDHAAKSVIMRDMTGANRHLDSAEFAARRVGPSALADVRAARRSLSAVPKGSTPNRNQQRFGATSAARQLKSIGSYGAIQGPRWQMNFSAETARLAVTPAPRGKPGGPGLYDVKGMGHSAYLQQIVKALIEKRGMPPGKAYAIARGAIRKWLRGGGHVHPEVRAAAAAAESDELAKQARAKATSHSVTGQAALEMAQPKGGSSKGGNKGSGRPQSSNWQNEARVPKGQLGGGEFGSSGKKQQGGGKKMTAPHTQGSIAERKAHLQEIARNDRAKAATLIKQLRGLEAQARHHGKSASSTPRQKGAGAQSQKQARKAQQQARASAQARASGKAPASRPGLSLQGKITRLRAEIASLLRQARMASAAARRL